jgi:xanthine dehydrogenase YagR molybdenum-binding subunit
MQARFFFDEKSRHARVRQRSCSGTTRWRRTVRSQLMGGMIWGISSALHEATELDLKRGQTR